MKFVSDWSRQGQLLPSLWPVAWTSTSARTTFSASQWAGGVTASWIVLTSQTKSLVRARSRAPSPRRSAVQLDSTSVWTAAACRPYCAATASPTVLRGRTSTAAVSLRFCAPRTTWGPIFLFFCHLVQHQSGPLFLSPPALLQCELGELVCEDSPGCIPLDKRCDHSADCLPFRSDESSCHGNAPSLSRFSLPNIWWRFDALHEYCMSDDYFWAQSKIPPPPHPG